jgi:hypothetical protein
MFGYHPIYKTFIFENDNDVYDDQTSDRIQRFLFFNK